MSLRLPAGGELVKVTEHHIGDGPARLKVGIAEDGTLLFVLPPSSEETIINLERESAIQILKHLVRLLEKPPADSRKRKRGRPASAERRP